MDTKLDKVIDGAKEIIDDKAIAIGALTVIAVGALIVLGKDCALILVPIVSIIGTLVTGKSKNGNGAPKKVD